MKIAEFTKIRRNDPEYAEYMKLWDSGKEIAAIYLDGLPAQYVIEAEDGNPGYVSCYVVDLETNEIIRGKDNEPLIERREGRVHYTYRTRRNRQTL